MNWQHASDGLRVWFAQRSGVHVDDVIWAGEPEGMHDYPCAWLSILAPSAAVGVVDEVLLHGQGPGHDALVQLRGHRACTLSCKVRTRDQSPTGRACVVLERVRDSLQLPSTQATMIALGLTVIEARALVDLGRVFDKRDESEAVLDVRLGFAVDTTANDADIQQVETVGTIEHVITTGQATDAAQTTIAGPTRLTP